VCGPEVAVAGVNALLQLLVSCIPPCFYAGIRERGSGLYEVLSRMLVPSTLSVPSISLVRASCSFFTEHKDRMFGTGDQSVGKKLDLLVSLCGSGVEGLFSLGLLTSCCLCALSSPGGLYRRCWGSGWDESEWSCVTCSCGGESHFSISQPSCCLIVRAEGGTLTAPLELDLGDLANDGLHRPLLYDLKAVIVRTLTDRYVCFSHRSVPGVSGGVWFQFDDEVVESIRAEEVCSTTGVVLMVYVLRGGLSEVERERFCMSLVNCHWRPVGSDIAL